VRATRTLTREDWIAAARKTLTSSGVDDVKVDRLSREMKVTRGSFYWHFKGRKDLLDTLLHDWEVRNLQQIDYLRAAWAEEGPDLAYVNVIYLGGDQHYPAYDMSIRIWARKSAAVAAAVGRIDEQWIRALTHLFVMQGVEETEAFVRGRINYFHQVGYYALALNETVEVRAHLVPYYYKVLSGRDPSPKLHAILSDILAHSPRSQRRQPAAEAGAKPRKARAGAARKTRANTAARQRA
jgi:AcrR family transcriptional regulator